MEKIVIIFLQLFSKMQIVSIGITNLYTDISLELRI
ncbi:unnamed protein product [Gulo gulo]|uniref:Uncharacterized protein n=1 Tax=Gulo gulo TaxID=48420 RepID=A0A9X9M9S3_GULGU|nr:unnamed protein product [Gulo gulo]